MARRPHLDPLPVFQQFDCQGCAKCCSGDLAVSVTAAEADMIVAQGWLEQPDFAGRVLFVERGSKLFMGHREDGACVFLNAAGRCRIHERFGSAAKPLACRLYPHMFLPVDEGIRVDLRFDCPSAAANRGRPLADQAAELEVLLPLVVPALDVLPVPLREGVGWPQARLDRLTEALDTLLTDDTLDFTRRLVGCINLCAALDDPRMARATDAEVDVLLASLLARLAESLTADPLHRARPSAGMRSVFRQLLGLYGRVDRISARPTSRTRFRQALALAWGRRMPRLRADWPEVAYAAVEGAWGVPAGDVAATLTRYLRMKLSAQAFCGVGFFGADYLPGVAALWLTIPVVLWYARFFAQGEGRDALTVADAEQALQVVDHRHGRTPQQALPGEQQRLKTLCDRATLRGLVVWYGT